MDKLINKEILYISYDGMTDALGQSQVLPYIIGLSKKGFRFTLISFEKREKFEMHRKHIQLICDDSKIDWRPLFYTKNPPIFSTIFDVFRLKKHSRQVYKEKKLSVVHCRSYISSIVGLQLKMKFNIKFIFDMRGFWVDERVEGNIWNLNNPFFKFVFSYFKRKEKKFFKYCDYCISLTEIGKNEILSWNINRNQELKIKVIPCCVDTSFFSSQNVVNERKKFWLNEFDIKDDSFTICYLGNLSTVYLFDDVLKVVKGLRKKNNKLIFLIFTHEPKQIVDSYLERNKMLDSVYIKIRSLIRSEVPEVLSVCDYSIYFCEPSNSRKGTSPTRLAELASCGVKVISNSKVGDTKEIIEDNNWGTVIDNFDNVTLQKLINNFNFEKDYDKTKIRKMAISLFDLNLGVERYFNVYKWILKN